ncbi:MAG: hypothetical protein WCI18_14390 [Pseudomonadota bacterium]
MTPRPTPIYENDWLSLGKKLGMKGNQKLCRPENELTFDELIARLSLKIDLSRLVSRIDTDGNTELTVEEKQVVSSTPICTEFADYIKLLGKALGLTSDSFLGDTSTDLDPEAFSGTMINGISFANEGHGWLIVNNRLTSGQTAISHLGVKYRDFDRLLSERQYDVEFKYTKQPAALRFKRGKTIRKVTEGVDRKRETCTRIFYVQHCTYDPQAKQGKCEQVPYEAQGTEVTRVDLVEESFTNTVQFMAPDFSKVLGVAQLASKRSFEESHLDERCDATAPGPNLYPYPTPR